MESKKMANLKKPLVASISILAVVAGAFYGALLLMREDPEQAKATQKAVRKEFRAVPMDVHRSASSPASAAVPGRGRTFGNWM